MPPTAYYTDSSSSHVTRAFTSSRKAASPFMERALSVPRDVVYIPPARSYSMERSHVADTHYTDFDCKVMAYSAILDQQDTARHSVSQARYLPSSYESSLRTSYPSDSFSARYDYYAGDKHGRDGLYPCSKEVLGTWKHYNLSAETLNARNTRARSPLVSRELDRYYETKKRSNYIGEISMGGATDFRYYNYRKVPYFGGSDNYSYMKQNGFKNSRRV